MMIPTKQAVARLLLLSIAELLIWSATASSAAAGPGGLTSLEVRAQFTQCGFELANPQAPPNNQYLVVEDPGAAPVRGLAYRILMAIVYRDTATAIAAHQQAHHQAEDRLGVRRAFNDNQGPQLLAGYSGSVWRANVAMVESDSATLDSMWSYDIQTDEARIARPELFDLGFVSSATEYAVDRDFVSCLEDGLLADTATLPTSVAPMYMPGRPW
jgi:hypothetical protein